MELMPFYNEELYAVILDCFSIVWPEPNAGKADMCVLTVLFHYAEKHECPGTLGFSTNTKVIKDFSTWADRSPISLALSSEFLCEQTVSLKNLSQRQPPTTP